MEYQHELLPYSHATRGSLLVTSYWFFINHIYKKRWMSTLKKRTAVLLRLNLVTIALATAFPSKSESIDERIPQVVKASHYQQDIDVSEYWKSEKLDGIRALWTGKMLVTQNGNPIYAPDWFIEKLPPIRFEGELWAGRGNFHLVQQTVLDDIPNDAAWKKIDLMLFDMPDSAGDYQKRYYNILAWVSQLDVQHVKYIEHTPIKTEKELFSQLNSVSEKLGEGLMLRKVTSRYQAGRSNDLLKLKKHQDAEALVIGYKSGTGKYKGKMGSILVRTGEGVEFYIGSGFTDEMRLLPPTLGSTVTYRYNGYTQNGVPKFARYLRERPNR